MGPFQRSGEAHGQQQLVPEGGKGGQEDTDEVVPFDRSCNELLFEALCTCKQNLDEPYTIIEDFSKEVYSNSSRADVKVKQVVRRYVELERDIVIWVSHCTPVEVKHKLLRGLAYNFRGYAITKRSPSSTPGNELTQLQLCSLISLDQDEKTKYGTDNVRALTNFLVVHAAKNILMHREHIENTIRSRS